MKLINLCCGLLLCISAAASECVLPVQVVSSSGKILHYPPEQLALRIGKEELHPSTISSVHPRVAVLLEIGSGTNTNSQQFPFVTLMAGNAVHELSSGHDVYFIAYADAPAVTLHPDSPESEKLAAISRLRHDPKFLNHGTGRGGTLDAIWHALNVLSPSQPGDALVVVTGTHGDGIKTPYAVLDRLRTTGTRLFIVAAHEVHFSTPESLDVHGYIKLASDSGGSGVEFENFRLTDQNRVAVDSNLRKMYKQIAEVDVLTFLGLQLKKTKAIQIRFGGTSSEPFVVKYPPVLGPCGK